MEERPGVGDSILCTLARARWYCHHTCGITSKIAIAYHSMSNRKPIRLAPRSIILGVIKGEDKL